MSEQSYPLDTNQVEWEDPRLLRDIYPTGVMQKVLWEDKKTGATIMMTKYPAGPGSEAHTHPKANEAFYILYGEGEDSEGNRRTAKGWFNYIPKGVKHGGTAGWKYTKETVIIQFFDGPRI